MAAFPGFVGFALNEGSSSPLGRRQNGCVKCLDASPECPACASNERCQVTIPMDCTQCPQAICVKDESASSSSSGSDSPNVGAIVGGVIGGLAAIAIITYLVWRFCIKSKRQQLEQDRWQEDSIQHNKEGMVNDFASRRSQRESTHTVHSIASTVLTRASNIIQIAYIPGVTNRATPTSPTLLVPPVPPIPLAHSESGKSSPYEEQHFFVPGDLRDSTYSGISSYTDRTSFARTSYAPRSSVASTIYGKNVVVSPMPAQKGNFLKPSIVSVKSRAASSNSGDSTPPVPTVDYDKYEKPPPSPTFSIGATFFKNANAATAPVVRPQIVRVGSQKSKSLTPTVVVDSDSSSPLEQVPETRKEEGSHNDDAEKPEKSPFSDPPVKGHKKDSSLSEAIRESTRRASGIPTHRSSRDASPFGDENALRD
ncbi:hypothetical protein F4775DRAFT_336352 [Biscogniauxia sp. FL1348]|nr:hypothetical protein F4775DRAFT_336352 [Biscogniauxia sp. FL1348]